MTPGQVREELGELLVQMSQPTTPERVEAWTVETWTRALISLERDLDWTDREVGLLRKMVADIYRALAEAEETP